MSITRTTIEIGKTFTDGKGNFRQITGRGNDFVLYSGQMNGDCLQYKLLAKKRGPYPVGSVCNSTVSSFMSWASREASPEELEVLAPGLKNQERTEKEIAR